MGKSAAADAAPGPQPPAPSPRPSLVGAAALGSPLFDAKDNESSLREALRKNNTRGACRWWLLALERAHSESPRPRAEARAIPADAPQCVAQAVTVRGMTVIMVPAPGRETGGVVGGRGIMRYRHIGTSAADRPDVREV